MIDHKELTTVEQIKAFSDPYRLKILTAFNRLERPATVKEIADKMNEVPAKVHYHVKKLEKAGIVSIVNTKEINGIIAKYYEPTAEKFIIKPTENNKELNKVILGETQRVIHNVYEESRQIILDEIANKVDLDSGEDDGFSESIYSSMLYLTKEEYSELTQIIDQFLKKDAKQKQGKRKVHMFSVLFPISIEDDKNK